MTNDVRKRKNVSKKEYDEYVSELYNRQIKKEAVTSDSHAGSWTLLQIISCLLGVVFMVICGLSHSWHVSTIHENNFWFTNIKEVEREISFRTESGLFYSYYKQLVQSKSISQGVGSLVKDNLTEFPSTINVLQRMNIYQEVFLAASYKLLAVKSPPIFFYVRVVFSLQAVLVSSLFLLAWMLSGSWLAGVMAAMFYTINKENTTRVEYTTPLRESFALPFLWLQIAAMSFYFQRNISRMGERFSLLVIGSSMFLFCLFWQFNQFIMLLQSLSLFGVWVLDIIPPYKVQRIMFMQLLSLFTVYYLQYYNPMILGGLLFSFLLSFYILIFIKGDDSRTDSSLFREIVRVIVNSVSVLLLTFIVNSSIKWFIKVDADEHIYKFVITKLGLGNEREFDLRLYICLDIFSWLPWSVYTSLTKGVVFPLYVIAHTVLLLLLVLTIFRHWRSKSEENKTRNCLLLFRPELAFHTIQCCLFGIMAITTMRMKYLWTPYMCVFAGFAVADAHFYKILFTSDKVVQAVRHVVSVVVIVVLIYLWFPVIQKELEVLQEFWDPDTVELMNWIKKNTKPLASFAGSMQLLAAVKLCTSRPITNHPHFEDKQLREKTKQIYQMYGRRVAGDVYSILRDYQADYIILEDSICQQHNQQMCSTPDIIDLNNGMVPDKGILQSGLKRSQIPRFCDQIRHNLPEYAKYFKHVFSNRTFRIYRVLK